MTSYIPGGSTGGGYSIAGAQLEELRVISNLILNDQGGGKTDQLTPLRTDAALSLGLPVPVPQD